MAQDLTWTSDQQMHTLAAIEVMRSHIEDGRGPIAAAVAVMDASEHVGVDGVIIGLMRLVVMLTDQIEATTNASPSDVLNDSKETVSNVSLVD